MHEGEVDVDEAVVGGLIAAQFPEWRALPIARVSSTGTVNAIFRLGDDLCARLPRLAAWAANLEREWAWLPVLAPRLTLRIPHPVAMGRPTSRYPSPWAIYRWIDGETCAERPIDDERAAARDLAAFVAELRSIEPQPGAPPAGRRPLRELDAVTRAAIAEAEELVDGAAASAAWDRALRAPSWDGRPSWIHADLLRPNVLVEGGRLAAVIDFGGVGVGDPATDLIPAWSVFGSDGRDAFRRALDADDGTWARARGIALHQALLIIPYYRESNPGFVETARRTVEEVVADS